MNGQFHYEMAEALVDSVVTLVDNKPVISTHPFSDLILRAAEVHARLAQAASTQLIAVVTANNEHPTGTAVADDLTLYR